MKRVALVAKNRPSGFSRAHNPALSASGSPPEARLRGDLRLACEHPPNLRHQRHTSRRIETIRPKDRCPKCSGILPTLSVCNWRSRRIQQLPDNGLTKLREIPLETCAVDRSFPNRGRPHSVLFVIFDSGSSTLLRRPTPLPGVRAGRVRSSSLTEVRECDPSPRCTSLVSGFPNRRTNRIDGQR